MIANCPSMDHWHRGLSCSARIPSIAGLVVLVTWLVGFGLWAVLAPIDGAVITQGTFVATGQNKLVQHLEGGIVRDILVKEGDVVDARQPLIRLDDTAARARLRRLTLRHARLSAMQARLHAEIAGKEAIPFPDELVQGALDAEVVEMVARQVAEFNVRRIRLQGEVEMLKREVLGHEETLAGHQAQLTAAEAQVALFRHELTDKHELLRKALVRKSDVMAVERAEARAVGDVGQLIGRIGDAKERIARTMQQIQQVSSTAAQRAVEELRTTETELDDIREQIRAARDVLERIEVLAPVRGVVVKLNHHTRGGVIAPGSTAMELLPINDDLVIETRVTPNDVVHVKAGQRAQIRLTTANQRLVPFIDGNVIYVSADAVTETDARRAAVVGNGNFVVRVNIDDADIKSKAKDFVPIPGMPAEVFIKTGERTFSSYVLKPLVDSFARAFREQ